MHTTCRQAFDLCIRRDCIHECQASGGDVGSVVVDAVMQGKRGLPLLLGRDVLPCFAAVTRRHSTHQRHIGQATGHTRVMCMRSFVSLDGVTVLSHILTYTT